MNAKRRHQSISLTLHQTLHGYSEGHRLLTSSGALPEQAESRMLFLSDLAGPGRVPGFDEYLTGYPVVEAGMYALARTWYADEMRRPGCVWTHTLLIPFGELAIIRDLRVLLPLFRRPTGNADFHAFSTQIRVEELEANEPSTSSWTNQQNAVADRVLEALYGHPRLKVVLPSKNARDYEDLLLQIWTQQWPRLRRSFWFCTGSLEPRNIPDVRFDLEVVPESNSYSFRERGTVFVGELDNLWLVDRTTSKINSEKTDLPAPWLELLRHALHQVKESAGSDFWIFGADVAGGRASVKPLCETFVSAWAVKTGRLSVSELLNSVAENFPDPNEALRLKTGLFGHPDERARLGIGWLGEKEVLSALGTSSGGASLPFEKLRVPERVNALVETSPAEGRELLIRLITRGSTSIGQTIFGCIVSSLPVGTLVGVVREHPALLATVVEHNSAFLLALEAWRDSGALQPELIDLAVQSEALDFFQRRQLVITMLEAGVRDLPYHSAVKFGASGVLGALDWLNQQPARSKASLAGGWVELMREHQGPVEAWIDQYRSPSASALTAVTAALEASTVIRGSASLWLDLVRHARTLKFLPPRDLQRVEAISFVVALRDRTEPAPELLASVFPSLHKELAEQSFPYEAWRILQEEVPRLLFANWDRCERLRQAFARAFVENAWAPHLFVQAAVEAGAGPQLNDYLGNWKEGKRYRKLLLQYIRSFDYEARSAS